MKTLLAVLALALTVGAAPGEGPAPLDEADRRAFSWFDGIGLPSCAGRPYVRITWSRTNPEGGRDEWSQTGFLLEETDEAWRILDDGLWTRTVPKREEGLETILSRLDLREAAATRLDLLRRLRTDPDAVVERIAREMESRLAEHAAILGFARHCAENGLVEEARELLREARRLPILRDGRAIEEPVEKVAARQLAESVLWRITLEFEDPAVSRKRLLEQLAAYLESFPESPHRERAEEAAGILERMLREDAEHPAVGDEELRELPPAERARELIFRLRDQKGGQFMQPGSPSIFDFFREEEDTPAHRLLELGWEAVPALIEALDDVRFTRTVGYWRDFCFSHYVVRIGDAARELLERITRQSFWEGTYTAASMVKDGDAGATKERYARWWRECCSFLAPLRRLAAAPDAEARAERARQLPDRGPGVIAGASPEAVWGTGSFAKALPDLDEEGARVLLRAVLLESPHPRTRSLAAWALLDLGDRGGIPILADLWRSLDAGAKVDPVRGGAVLSFLASCGDAGALSALAEGLDAEPPGVREIVLLAFDAGGFGPVRGLAGDPGGGLREPFRHEGEAARLAEDIVAARLADLEEDPLERIPPQLLAEWDDRFAVGRRIADAAVRILGRRWPEAYPYDPSPGILGEEWERLRVQFLETWKRRSAAGPR